MPRFAPIDASLLETSGANPAFVPASLSDTPVSVVLEMAGAAVAVVDAGAQARGQGLSESDKHAIRQELKAQQDALQDGLAGAGASVVGQMQDAYNGIQVIVPQKNLTQLAGLPGVIAVHATQVFTPSNVNGVPFVGAPSAWGNFSVTGAGVKIAVIDTGIDYTHADFGGPGTVPAWTAAKAASTAPADPSLFGPAAPKVKGGFDFVGDAYNANIAGSKPMPDTNPLDCNGHGSHTAGTAAGFGVLSDGSTFHGPYNATTITSHTWNVGPGVAPGADIYAYRVFGCTGSSNIVALAINKAVADGVNVISMSLGSDLGGTDDPTSVAAQNAFNAGIAVIASAGNAGGGAYVVGSPSTANGVLSVAAIDGSVANYPGAHLLLSSGGAVDALDANGAPISTTTYPVRVLRNADGSVSLGCNPDEYAGTAGMLVVTKRGSCARVARAIFGQQNGAAAVAMINTSPGYPVFEGQITSNPDNGHPFTVTIPFLGIQGTTTTVNDAARLVAADGGTVNVSSTSVANSNYRLAASFTSGGPRSSDSAPKPDVMAPGVSVASAGMGTGNQAAVISGTSMAAPMTAGIAALVKQQHPGWNGAQIKAAIMNTADPSKNFGYNSRLAGTGVVQAQNAVNSTVLATTADSLDAIKFGYVPGAADYSASVAFSLTNAGTSVATYNLSVVPNGSLRNAGITVSPTTVSVAAGATSPVNVSLSMSAAAFAALQSDDTFSIGPGSVLTVRGDIVGTPAAGHPIDQQTLRLPFMLVPRGLSDVVAGAPSDFSNVTATADGTPGNTISATLPIGNNGIHAGTADLYAWGIHAARRNGQPNDVRDVGVQVLPGGALHGSAGDRSLVFLINTWGQSANQSVNEYDILIDTNGDGIPDFALVGVDAGRFQTGAFNGVFAAFTINISTGKVVAAFTADAPMNGSTIELPTLASKLGLSQRADGVGTVKKQGFTYSVNAFSIVRGGSADRVTSTTATVNPFSPSVSSGDFATLAAGGSTSFTLTVDTDQQKAQPALGWLVASVDNANGAAQAGEVPVPTK